MYIDECGMNLVQAPTDLTVTCADGNERLTGLKWWNWGIEEAGATGFLEMNDCEPSCADGKTVAYPVVVMADGIDKGEASARYTNLDVEFSGKVPPGYSLRQAYALAGLKK